MKTSLQWCKEFVPLLSKTNLVPENCKKCVYIGEFAWKLVQFSTCDTCESAGCSRESFQEAEPGQETLWLRSTAPTVPDMTVRFDFECFNATQIKYVECSHAQFIQVTFQSAHFNLADFFWCFCKQLFKCTVLADGERCQTMRINVCYLCFVALFSKTIANIAYCISLLLDSFKGSRLSLWCPLTSALAFLSSCACHKSDRNVHTAMPEDMAKA